jgi:catechol 2,3-dioxygenase-like lactoylglutathione lyase family enzyme
MKITAVLMVDKIETSLSFWVDRMGFTKTAEVPDGDSIAFVILGSGNAELMLQTIESIRKDTPQFVPKAEGHDVGLFIEVDDFGETLKRLEGYPIAMPDRTTFYGMREIGVYAPSGHVVTFGSRI